MCTSFIFSQLNAFIGLDTFGIGFFFCLRKVTNPDCMTLLLPPYKGTSLKLLLKEVYLSMGEEEEEVGLHLNLKAGEEGVEVEEEEGQQVEYILEDH